MITNAVFMFRTLCRQAAVNKAPTKPGAMHLQDASLLIRPNDSPTWILHRLAEHPTAEQHAFQNRLSVMTWNISQAGALFQHLPFTMARLYAAIRLIVAQSADVICLQGVDRRFVRYLGNVPSIARIYAMSSISQWDLEVASQTVRQFGAPFLLVRKALLGHGSKLSQASFPGSNAAAGLLALDIGYNGRQMVSPSRRTFSLLTDAKWQIRIATAQFESGPQSARHRYSQYDLARRALTATSGDEEIRPKIVFATDFGCMHSFELSPLLQNGRFYDASWLATREGLFKSEDSTNLMRNKRLPPTLGLLYPHLRSVPESDNAEVDFALDDDSQSFRDQAIQMSSEDEPIPSAHLAVQSPSQAPRMCSYFIFD